jgi:hypothetical protein
MNKNRITSINKIDFKLYLYLFISFIFLITIGIRAVKGEINFEFYADSETYIEFMNENQSLSDILLLYPNMLGPTLILKILNQSFIGVFLFNIFIVLFFYFSSTKNNIMNKKYLFFYLLISPMFFSSVLTINKEIISILSITLFFKYFKSKSYLMLILSLFFSILVRWQMSLFIICLTILLTKWNPFKKYRLYLVIFFLLTISLFYYFNLSSFEKFNKIAELGQETAIEGSGLFSNVLKVQNSNILGYFLAFIPKFLFLFIGVLVRFYKLLDFTDFYNNVVVFTQCIANFIILVNIIKLKIKLDNIYFFSAIVYCIIFSLSPIFAPRYLFPGYILFAMAIASHKSNLSLKSAIKNNKENVL